MRYAEINGTTVVNVVEATAAVAKTRGWVRASDDVLVGWHYENGEFTAAPAPPPPVPDEVTMRQARQAIILAGLDEQIEAALAQLPGQQGKLARAEWEYATVFRRNHPLVIQLGAALGLSETDIDGLITQAAALA